MNLSKSENSETKATPATAPQMCPSGTAGELRLAIQIETRILIDLLIIPGSMLESACHV